jgi:hypothetical protein
MPPSGMLRRVGLERNDFSEERSASIIWMTRFGKLRKVLGFLSRMIRLLITANVVPSSLILVTLMMAAISSSDTTDLTRVTRHNIPEGGIFIVTAVLPLNLT